MIHESYNLPYFYLFPWAILQLTLEKVSRSQYSQSCSKNFLLFICLFVIDKIVLRILMCFNIMTLDSSFVLFLKPLSDCHVELKLSTLIFSEQLFSLHEKSKLRFSATTPLIDRNQGLLMFG